MSFPTIDAPCGVPAHRMGRWVDVVLGIWFCPDCGEEIWVTEEAEHDEACARGVPAPRGASAVDARDGSDAVPDVRDDPADPRASAGAPGDRASDGGARLWSLIVDAFGRERS